MGALRRRALSACSRYSLAMRLNTGSSSFSRVRKDERFSWLHHVVYRCMERMVVEVRRKGQLRSSSFVFDGDCDGCGVVDRAAMPQWLAIVADQSFEFRHGASGIQQAPC